jgi:predicted nuclease of predicted toxin-antitoxin system
VKFKLDENMPAALASLLRERGHDVTDVVEEGLGGAKDRSISKAATTEGRILLTFDLHFANIRNYALGTHAGVVVFRLQDQRWKTLQIPVTRLLEDGSFEQINGGLAIVTENEFGGNA